MKHTEKILVAKRDSVVNHIPVILNAAQTMDTDSNPTKVLTDIDFQWMVRKDAEVDPDYKQIIPYIVVVKHTDEGRKFLTYSREKGSGEERLLGSRSLGFGGHIDIDQEINTRLDKQGMLNAFNLLCLSADRELNEEIGLSDGDYAMKSLIGFVNNDGDDVGSVHLGVVMQCMVMSDWNPEQREDGVADLRWQSLEEIQATVESYEVWSQLIATKFYF
mgnify:CR=1 FL=1|jgi:predicted NUDIX family phosphoesterase|tara:strand:- start:4070 stop:4723 length:654 start_codon:yes stop_codon:yes gene_type:complete